jgi:hypothetical protein
MSIRARCWVPPGAAGELPLASADIRSSPGCPLAVAPGLAYTLRGARADYRGTAEHSPPALTLARTAACRPPFCGGRGLAFSHTAPLQDEFLTGRRADFWTRGVRWPGAVSHTMAGPGCLRSLCQRSLACRKCIGHSLSFMPCQIACCILFGSGLDALQERARCCLGSGLSCCCSRTRRSLLRTVWEGQRWAAALLSRSGGILRMGCCCWNAYMRNFNELACYETAGAMKSSGMQAAGCRHLLQSIHCFPPLSPLPSLL